MGQYTKIEWCDHTFNPWMGCSKVSSVCANCFAEAFARRFGRGFSKRERTSADNWKLPVRWNAAAGGNPKSQNSKLQNRPRVFCGSLCDWLDDSVPVEWLADLLVLIHKTPNLDWLLLTKRPENFKSRLRESADFLRNGCTNERAKTVMWIYDWFHFSKPPANVWVGTTVENQEMADKRIPDLLKIPAGVRFLSCEPLLGAVSLRWLAAWPEHGNGHQAEAPWHNQTDPANPYFTIGTKHLDGLRAKINWVICGGESGREARPMHPDWARGLRDQCKDADVPFFFKQWGEWCHYDQFSGDQAITRKMIDTETPDGLTRVGKKAAGRLLDGVEYNEFPKMENH